MPVELVEVYQSLTKGLKGNEKWLVASAAFLSLLRMPEHDRYDLFGKIKAAPTTIPNDLRPISR